MGRISLSTSVVVLLVLVAAAPTIGGLWDTVKGALGDGAKSAAPAEPTGGEGDLSLNEVAWGLREALAVGARKAVSQASAEGGFLDNPAIEIPLPDRLTAAAGILRSLGLGTQVDQFQETLNRSAERAAGEAYPIFSDAVSQLTFDDVRRIWKGADNAATEYLEAKTRGALYERFEPVVHGASMEVGVTRAYQSLVGRPEVASLVAGSDLDLDHFVTDRSLDGLFHLLAEEEQRIRTEPVARTTDLLKRVFGATKANLR